MEILECLRIVSQKEIWISKVLPVTDKTDKTTEQISLKTMVAFTPPNATSLPWLTDQGVVATFMALHYVISN